MARLGFFRESARVTETRAEDHDHVVRFQAGAAANTRGRCLEPGVEVAHARSAKTEGGITIGDEEKGVSAHPQAPPTDAHDEIEQ